MAQHAELSGSTLALARRRRLLAAPGPTGRGLNGPSALPREVQPAELAQARLFEELLRTELTELDGLAHRETASVDDADARDSEPSRSRDQIAARIEEIRGLLAALNGRFPHDQQS